MSDKKLYAPKHLVEKLVAIDAKKKYYKGLISQIAEDLGKCNVDGIRVWVEIKGALGDNMEFPHASLAVNYITGEITTEKEQSQ